MGLNFPKIDIDFLGSFLFPCNKRNPAHLGWWLRFRYRGGFSTFCLLGFCCCHGSSPKFIVAQRLNIFRQFQNPMSWDHLGEGGPKFRLWYQAGRLLCSCQFGTETRCFQRANIPTIKKPTGLMEESSLRPDGYTISPWAQGRFLAWDVTFPHTMAEKYINLTSQEAGAAALRAADFKNSKYAALAESKIFQPVCIETFGLTDAQTQSFLNEFCSKIVEVSEYLKTNKFKVISCFEAKSHLGKGFRICIDINNSDSTFTDSALWDEDTIIREWVFKPNNNIDKKNKNEISIDDKHLSNNDSNYYTVEEFSKNILELQKHIGCDFISILHLNARSLFHKLLNPEILLKQFDFIFKIIVISESWLNDETADLIKLNNYNFVYKNRRNRRGGGVGMFIKDDVKYVVNESNIFDDDNADTLCVEFELHQASLHNMIKIIAIYRPPSYKYESFLEKIESILNSLNPLDKIFIVGDFNINLMDKTSKDFQNFSDPYPIYTVVENTGFVTTDALTLKRNINKRNISLIKEALSSEKWDSITDESNIDTCCMNCYNQLNRILDIYAPLQPLKRKNKKPWLMNLQK
ncbi:hypothetical protein HELRODRAFT_177514 [Helobdella robusta]|uniref:Endonuclease/exonuclease/phosphatase domain-containing protein n=1 Tax=Helobdella robusta TaxID=6412 RepID=T1FBT9_HELRO|nr:hypothetical protein HELRODRAFT_177514 [Helobdella robusta]ESN97872.1 hypothetical protein HELRODRAFT_177514 [Helobdella robusta]